ncbi:hypothetical protein NXY49_20090 [Bacteroides fragilis]|nr:hypothetical protein [Bacteroides fragilis]
MKKIEKKGGYFMGKGISGERICGPGSQVAQYFHQRSSGRKRKKATFQAKDMLV